MSLKFDVVPTDLHPFDMAFLKAELTRSRIPPFSETGIIDPLVFVRAGMAGHGLCTIRATCLRLGLPAPAESKLSAAIAAGRVLHTLGGQLPSNVSELLDLQEALRDEWLLRFWEDAE